MESTRALRADLFDPASLAALGRIEIVARWIVDGFMSGLHRSPRKGFSVEFAEYRPYQPGDDLRYVDWKIAARLPIPAGELLRNRIRTYGWVEIQGEKHHTAIRLTPAGLQAMRSAI